MYDAQRSTPAPAPALHIQWLEVRDGSGRSHLEAHWVPDTPAPTYGTSHGTSHAA